ncbi:regulator of volume decrease after cellular swelling-domain-containing protein [Endogone sp. FLAS-F59071]|nr:regulator of volume decrease after cellular swelling-domain-containing protein [Endogone sp. FLAS-F59071]|eukprot:RUS23315.1 regulator of volume decrease after cellular swelling-domain-containing protein [Endogone sp. FLAS-F59071]
MPLTLLNSPPNLEGESIHHRQDNVQMVITPPLNGVSDLGKGDLFVAENQLYFYTRNTATGLAIPYPSIIIHAISRQNGQPCVYCQLDSGEVLAEQRRVAEDDDDEDKEVTELKLVPDDPDASILEFFYFDVSPKHQT